MIKRISARIQIQIISLKIMSTLRVLKKPKPMGKNFDGSPREKESLVAEQGCVKLRRANIEPRSSTNESDNIGIENHRIDGS